VNQLQLALQGADAVFDLLEFIEDLPQVVVIHKYLRGNQMSTAIIREPLVDIYRKPLYPPKPLKDLRRHVMTIVLGFRCTDGVIICADQQITAPGAFKYHQTKIKVEHFDSFAAVFAYSGLPGLALEVHDKIANTLRKMSADQPVSKIVRETADNVLSNMGRLYTELELQMLIGTSARDEKAALVRFDGKSVHAAVDFNYMGVGESSLIRFLAQKLYTSKIDLEIGADLGAYLIKKAEDYIDGCGGPIDVVAVGDDYAVKKWSHAIVQERIRAMERQEAGLQAFLITKPFSPTLP
jgi:20S proteasome alpha/beta subunit